MFSLFKITVKKKKNKIKNNFKHNVLKIVQKQLKVLDNSVYSEYKSRPYKGGQLLKKECSAFSGNRVLLNYHLSCTQTGFSPL